MSVKLVLQNVRLAYANVWEPRSINDGPLKYSCALLIDKTDAALIQQIQAATNQAIREGTEKFGQKFQGRKLPLRDGDEEDRGEDYRGTVYLNASSTTAPQIVDGQVKPVMNRDDVYSGCYANVSVQFYPFSTSGNQGVAVGLGNIQKVRDGAALDGRTRAEDEFTPLADPGAAGGLGGLLD